MNSLENEQTYWNIHEARFKFLLEKIEQLPLPSTAEILDVGCYPPFLMDALTKKGFRVSGIASHHEQMEQEHVKVLNIETDPFPWKPSQFDCVIFTEVIEHLPHNPQIPLKEIFRVLKPGGFLLISTPNGVKLHHRLRMLAGKPVTFPLDQLIDSHPNDGSIYMRHNKEYTMEELEFVVTSAGFTVSQKEHVVLYPPTRKKTRQTPVKEQLIRWAGYVPQMIYPPFRDSLFVLAKKV
jgi:2-polyprenyl-3-methyl-5-hydroxy-6-metoxy-1,4-benzoquinol methylase